MKRISVLYMEALSVFLLAAVFLLTVCARKPQYREEAYVLEQEHAVTFTDGGTADLWRAGHGPYSCYKLTDGTALLHVHDVSGPDHVYVGGIDGFDDLNQTAQASAKAYYEKQGLLYDIHQELEDAYSEYSMCRDNGTGYEARRISQDISPTASNDTIMCFLTTVSLPLTGGSVREIRLGAVFDRETGRALSNWELFGLPEDEARQWILKAADISDPGLLSEMEAAMKPEYIILFPDALEVAFPQGTLPSQEYSYVVGFDYDKELKAVLQPWAVPDSSQGVGKIGENGIIGVSELYFRTGFWYNRRKFLHGL